MNQGYFTAPLKQQLKRMLGLAAATCICVPVLWVISCAAPKLRFTLLCLIFAILCTSVLFLSGMCLRALIWMFRVETRERHDM